MTVDLNTTLNSIILLFGGPAVILVTAAIVSAYNQWRMRCLLEDLKSILKTKENTLSVVSTKNAPPVMEPASLPPVSSVREFQ